jgi:hypothetical protein
MIIGPPISFLLTWLSLRELVKSRFMKLVNTLRRSQWPRGLRLRFAAERLLGSLVRIPPGGGVWMFVSCTVFVLSGRGLCGGPIPRPDESHRLWCVSECDQVKINNLDTCCEQVGRRGKDYENTLQLPVTSSVYSVVVFCWTHISDIWNNNRLLGKETKCYTVFTY